jgi:ABC-type uncharacterized transport system permease subunit
MPPLLEMDQTLARIAMVGIALLSLTLLTGMVVNLDAGLPALRFDHKTLFTLLTWVMVGVFLLGRGRMGWRGRVAARFVLGGFAMLLLAYVGSRFVLEIFIAA